MNNTLIFPSEWQAQDAILMAFPHEDTDWAYMLDEARDCFAQIINAITNFNEAVILIVNNKADYKYVINKFGDNVYPVFVPFNDTWTRDFGPVFVQKGDVLVCLDFKFNGWGLKYAANKDNLVNGNLLCKNIFLENVVYQNHLNFVLEGGSLESDGKGTLLTTAECLLSPNRNGEWNRLQIENYLKTTLGLKRTLWLHNGKLKGDDTDGHIDTLARFCDHNSIVYVKNNDKNDCNYYALSAMEEELQQFTNEEGAPYKLTPLLMPEPVFHKGKRLPATYANFLIMNNAVLLPVYQSSKDEEAIKIITSLFPDRTVVPIDCKAMIKQYGSLHCATMQLPKGTVNFDTLKKIRNK